MWIDIKKWYPRISGRCIYIPFHFFTKDLNTAQCKLLIDVD